MFISGVGPPCLSCSGGKMRPETVREQKKMHFNTPHMAAEMPFIKNFVLFTVVGTSNNEKNRVRMPESGGTSQKNQNCIAKSQRRGMIRP
ncbi:MAG: hypothetical protein GC149_08260 [Gammaproteobacteria bacterium]|nr:hypothetical protein [Gammaproteobacteria bacterium]